MIRITFILCAALGVAALTACAPAARPRWSSELVDIMAAPGVPDMEKIDMPYLTSELEARGLVGGKAGRLVVVVESLNTAPNGRVYFRGTIRRDDGSDPRPATGEGYYRVFSSPYMTGPRSRAAAIIDAVGKVMI